MTMTLVMAGPPPALGDGWGTASRALTTQLQAELALAPPFRTQGASGVESLGDRSPTGGVRTPLAALRNPFAAYRNGARPTIKMNPIIPANMEAIGRATSGP